MHISFIELQNFRKLKSIRVDFSEQTTVFVGANNSGKTSAMVALSYFLIDETDFTTNDFTLSNWKKLNEIGKRWEAGDFKDAEELLEWESILPSIDIWLHVESNEIYYVRHLLPTIEWSGGLLGVRLRYEPKNIIDFFKEFLLARKSAKETLEMARSTKNQLAKDSGEITEEYTVNLWPVDLCEFLERKLHKLFTVSAYTLDPSQCLEPKNGVAIPQALQKESEPIEGDHFKKLIRIDKIDAHRGFSNLSSKNSTEEEIDMSRNEKGKLSEQLRAYYKKHIDPSSMPDPSDVDALEAIYKAQKQFDEKLKTGFKSKFDELEDLGYPGITDPKLNITTKLRPVDGLNHSSALKYKVASNSADGLISPCLPEHYNGLGYQNLISMVFKLMSFRDDWMQVGKAGKRAASISTTRDDIFIPPLHLVLIEEPEAHLHVQVQQVFIRKAYDVLRNHDDLKQNKILSTQLVISTHSNHIAHEVEFSCLRYFRRRPILENDEVPITTVVNLSEVFGKQQETERFVSRYIKATHCDLFFADGAILVEGPAERMLVPHFIREHFLELHQSYITILEIGGSHAHRLRSLIEHLGLITLIITDLDCVDTIENNSFQPKRNQGYITQNSTLRTWIPQKNLIDDLLNLPEREKIKEYDPFFSIRVAYQCPIKIQLGIPSKECEALSNTFEDAFVFENIALFSEINGTGLIKKFKTFCADISDTDEMGNAIFVALKKGDKAQFALDILFLEDPKKLIVPTYIREGLSWLAAKLKRKQREDFVEQVITTLTEQLAEANE